MLDFATAMCDRTRAGGEALGSVQKISTKIRLGFLKLGETVATIRALRPLTRIETSRLGVASAGFVDLSDEVTPLSDRIQSSIRKASSPNCGVRSLRTCTTPANPVSGT